jgi:hypothetical protein
MQRLLVYQAVWGMEKLPCFDLAEDFEGALDQVLAAGFDGVGVSLTRTGQSETVSRLMADRGRSWEALAFATGTDDLARAIARADVLGAHHLTVQVTARTGVLQEAVALFEALQAVASQAAMPVYFETHRGRLTNDLLLMEQVLEALPTLRLTADLSHYAVAHELVLPLAETDARRMGGVLDHAWAVHGRVASSHQVQVSVEAPQHQAWVAQFGEWWTQAFRSWRRRAGPDAELSFMSELGPPHYAIVGADGRELADRWTEAVTLARIARACWTAAQDA